VTFLCTPQLSLEGIRCWECGRWWAKENCPSQCPYCAEKRAKDVSAGWEADRRTIAALRGALTKAKRVSK